MDADKIVRVLAERLFDAARLSRGWRSEHVADVERELAPVRELIEEAITLAEKYKYGDNDHIPLWVALAKLQSVAEKEE